jgi:hypothetical protein
MRRRLEERVEQGLRLARDRAWSKAEALDASWRAFRRGMALSDVGGRGGGGRTTGVKNTDKGFDLRVCPADDFQTCSGQVRGGQCRAVGEFDGIAVKSFSHTGTLPAGRWTLFVKNTYKNFFRATIHVHATAGQ